MKIERGMLLAFISIYLFACSTDSSPKNVGDIAFDPDIDRKEFKLCDEKRIYQYYVRYSSDKAPGYEGEKPALEKVFEENYFFPKIHEQTGYITIRFIVNCKGETGRFRIEEMDKNYQEFQFDSEILENLLEITKNLDGWIPRKKEGIELDYYQYLTFKMEDGQITQILP